MVQKNQDRKQAVDLLLRVIQQGQSLTAVLQQFQTQCTNEKDKSFVQALVYGVCRFYCKISAQLTPFIKKPLKTKDFDIQLLLCMGVYQIDEMNVPDYAAVSETADTAKSLGKSWAVGFCNGVLRNYQRSNRAKIPLTSAQTYAFPDWLYQVLRQDWPTEYTAIMLASNQPASIFLRINQRKIDREQYLELLRQSNIEFELPENTVEAVQITSATKVMQLPGLQQGLVSVQDLAAQRAAYCLDLSAQQTVLDVCAAPGGKTCHILEMADVEVTAIDINSQRLLRVQENLQRLSLQAKVKQGDALVLDAWWDKQLYDRILLDAPCSATGVIRRHPDIKIHRNEHDIQALVAIQASILDKMWACLAPGGILLYATCSVLKCENEQQVSDFLVRTKDANELPLAVEWGMQLSVGRQILPGDQGMDGFYYARIVKT